MTDRKLAKCLGQYGYVNLTTSATSSAFDLSSTSLLGLTANFNGHDNGNSDENPVFKLSVNNPSLKILYHQAKRTNDFRFYISNIYCNQSVSFWLATLYQQYLKKRLRRCYVMQPYGLRLSTKLSVETMTLSTSEYKLLKWYMKSYKKSTSLYYRLYVANIICMILFFFITWYIKCQKLNFD